MKALPGAINSPRVRRNLALHHRPARRARASLRRRRSWAQLFRRDASYVRTDLLRDGSSYVTLDWWTSRAAYDRFRELHAADYAALDRTCEVVTVLEEKLGEFATVD